MHRSTLPTTHYRKLVVAVALGCAGAVALPVLAAEAIEEVRVTGSFLERPADRPQPVTVIDNEALRLEQRSSIAEVFKNLPQSIGSTSMINSQQGGVNGGNTPTATINLRGLGPRATLVLLNGGRQTSDGGFGFVDINNLTPSIMVERVEILTDGASALYGSDAVAGVANFITRNNFSGLEVRAEAQQIQDTNANRPDMNFGLIAGGGNETTHVVAAVDYATTEILLVEDRYDDARLRLGLTSGFGNPATYQVQNVNGTLRPTTQTRPDPLCGSSQIGGGLAAGEVNPTRTQCLLFNALNRDMQPKSERMIGMSVITHDFTDTLTGEFELGFARTDYTIPFGYVTPAGVTSFSFVPVDNPGVLEAVRSDPSFPNPANDANVGGYRFRGRVMTPAGGPSNDHFSSQDTRRFAARLKGEINEDWGWQFAYTNSWNETSFQSTDTLIARLTSALNGYGGPNCQASPTTDPNRTARGVGNCKFWNPFANSLLAKPGDRNYNDPALTRWLTGSRTTVDTGELRTFDLVVTGSLWDMAGGTTGLAVGLHRREQDFSQDWDVLSEAPGNWAFNGATAFLDFGGQRTTDAAFAELVMYPTETLEVQLAARYEDAGTQDSFDPKIGLLWTPMDGLYLRASAGTSFRQPGEIQVFGSGPGGASTDPIGGDTINARGLLVGNPNLESETSDNWTAGVTWDITEAFTAELNYWSVDFQNLITQEQSQAILLLDRADGFITDPRIILRDGAPNEVCEVTGRWSGRASDPRPANCMSGFDVQLFRTTYINQAFQKTEGLDFVFNYEFDALASQWSARLLGSWTTKYDMDVQGKVVDGVGSYNTATFGVPNPEWRSNVMLDWKHDNHMARATVRYLSKLELDVRNANNQLTEEEDFTTLDLQYSYTLAEGAGSVTFTVINATDEEDPLRHGAQTTSTSSIYESRGRVYRLAMNWMF
ncbi:MAG: TonB-dependent receptor plug domain-containing protein [Pseudohongiellaceae bacterium]|jgi:iron complex outermembrane recepter protein